MGPLGPDLVGIRTRFDSINVRLCEFLGEPSNVRAESPASLRRDRDMIAPRMPETAIGEGNASFRETLWTVVLGAKKKSRDALERLIRQYWKPVYFFIRRRGYGVEEAKDLTQGYFAAILEGDALRSVTQSRGRFRTFLLAVLKNYLADASDRRKARKRGGGAVVLPLDFAGAERELGVEPASADNPEREFHRQWALEVVERALRRLEKERPGKAFEALRAYLTSDPPGYMELAERLGISEEAVTNHLHRMRARLHVLIREEVRESVSSSRDLKEELRDLLGYL